MIIINRIEPYHTVSWLDYHTHTGNTSFSTQFRLGLFSGHVQMLVDTNDAMRYETTNQTSNTPFANKKRQTVIIEV